MWAFQAWRRPIGTGATQGLQEGLGATLDEALIVRRQHIDRQCGGGSPPGRRQGAWTLVDARVAHMPPR